jgi:hypothetical protein
VVGQFVVAGGWLMQAQGTPKKAFKVYAFWYECAIHLMERLRILVLMHITSYGTSTQFGIDAHYSLHLIKRLRILVLMLITSYGTFLKSV